jgi:tRNA1(Val) A37 N6-methylase TrmN6
MPVSMRADASAPPANSAITEDRILGGRIQLHQPATGYRVGIDPVFLAAAVPMHEGGRALDLGCGVAAAALCLAWRQPGLQITGLEIQPALAKLATGNAALNQMGGRLTVLVGDLLRAPDKVATDGFDIVLANPPFYIASHSTAPREPGRAMGHMEGEADLARWIGRAIEFATPGGALVMIHKPERIGEILVLLEGRAGAVELFPLWAGVGKPARRILLRAKKGSGALLTLHQGLVLHEADGRYTPAAEAVLRGGEGLDF